MPQLTTPRLHCVPLQPADWPFFLALQQDRAVMRFVADGRTESEIRDAFTARLQPWSPGDSHWLCLLVRDAVSGQPLGVTGYVHREPDVAEVGFLFAPQAQGKGYGLESLRAVCEFAWQEGGIRRLTASVTAGNVPSRRVLEKCGFVLEGELRDSYWLHGDWHNDWLFGALRREWPGPSGE